MSNPIFKISDGYLSAIGSLTFTKRPSLKVRESGESHIWFDQYHAIIFTDDGKSVLLFNSELQRTNFEPDGWMWDEWHYKIELGESLTPERFISELESFVDAPQGFYARVKGDKVYLPNGFYIHAAGCRVVAEFHYDEIHFTNGSVASVTDESVNVYANEQDCDDFFAARTEKYEYLNFDKESKPRRMGELEVLIRNHDNPF